MITAEKHFKVLKLFKTMGSINHRLLSDPTPYETHSKVYVLFNWSLKLITELTNRKEYRSKVPTKKQYSHSQHSYSQYSYSHLILLNWFLSCQSSSILRYLHFRLIFFSYLKKFSVDCCTGHIKNQVCNHQLLVLAIVKYHMIKLLKCCLYGKFRGDFKIVQRGFPSELS